MKRMNVVVMVETSAGKILFFRGGNDLNVGESMRKMTQVRTAMIEGLAAMGGVGKGRRKRPTKVRSWLRGWETKSAYR